MKRTGIIVTSILMIWTAAGCVSSGETVFARPDPIALVSVVSNDSIDWQGEETIDMDTISPFTARALRGDPDKAIVTRADELITTAEKLIRETMANTGKVKLADREPVLASRAYGEARLNKYQMNRDEVIAAGLRYVDYRDKNFFSAFAAETGITRSMFVEFDFAKMMDTGFGKNGSCRAMVKMTLFIVDDGGKTLYKKVFSLTSGDTVRVSSGVYSTTELLGMFESAVVDSCYEFIDHIEN